MTFAFLWLIAAIAMAIRYARLKKENALPKMQKADKIWNNKRTNNYDNFVAWWSSCNEKEIQTNSLLLGAYQIMWLYHKVRSGGFEQFFDFAKEWDMERTSKLFKWLLPKEFYHLFLMAFQSYKNGEDCEKYNNEFDYDKMEKQVLPKLAERISHNYKNQVTLTEYDLIEGVTPYLKARGYKRKNKRWTKDIGEFTLVFLIQGSTYDIDSYYIRPGIFVNGLEQKPSDYYGHFYIGIKQQSVEQVIYDYEQFIAEWTNKTLIKSRLEQFDVWEQRNPLEKRRALAEKNPYKKDPIPTGCDVFLCVNDLIKKHILENF